MHEKQDGLEDLEERPSRIRFTRITSANGILTKRLALDAVGNICKAPTVHLSEGQAEIVEVNDIEGFCNILVGLDTSQALTYGVPLNGGGRILSRRAYEAAGAPPDATTRTEEAFAYPANAGVIMIDHDPLPGREPLTRDALLQALYAVFPLLAACSHAWWPSSSSMIFNSDRQVAGLRGQRVYVIVQDATDIARAGRALVERLWLSGHGAVVVSAAGSMLERTIIDATVYQASRLDFAAGAVCDTPLSQRRGAPVVLNDGPYLETREALPSLTDEEAKRLQALVRAVKASAIPEATRVRAEWVEGRGGAIASERGLPLEVARSIAKDAVDHLRLRGDFVLTTEDGREVSVGEALGDVATWHGVRFRHPLDVDYPDHRIGYLNLKPTGGKPFLYVHANGGIKFTLIATARTIQVQSGSAVANVEDVLSEMRACGRFYARGNDICTVSADGDLVALGHHALKHLLESVLSFERFAETKLDEATGRKGKFVPCDMPDDLARRVRELVSHGTLPRLTGVVKHAIVAPDGRVLREGFDKKTGLLVVRSDSRPWVRPRDYPTMDEVHQAIGALWHPFRLVPFATAVDRGVHLAALLTAVVRKALRTAPMFLYAAPSKGSGKSMVCEALAILAGSDATPSSALPSDEAEVDKLLVSVLRAGSPVLWLDNVTGNIKAAALCRLLTSETYEARILGRSETTGALPTRMLIVASGNNVSPSADMTRRTLRCYIDPKMEVPASRVFDWSPLALVRESKDQMIGAALTVLAAWVRTDEFKAARGRVGSFEDHDRLIGQCVRWVASCGITTEAGEPFGDPKTAVDEAQAADTDQAEVEALLATWVAGAHANEMTAAAIFAEVQSIRSGSFPRSEAGYAALAIHEAGWCGHSSRSLGKYLAAEVNKIAGGYVLRSRGGKNALLWRVERAPSAA